MADQENKKDLDITLLKNTKISVSVDEALPDILVVTYEHGVKIFKGVLLDSTKRNLPCGVQTVNPAFNAKSNPDDDVLYSVNQRFAYTDPRNAKKKSVQIPSKYKNNKMTVRLRPRQVLCSKCKGICNENSENVSRKRKSSESVHAMPPIKRGANAPVTRSVYSELSRKKDKQTLVPRRLEVSNALSGNVNKLNILDNLKRPPSPDAIKCSDNLDNADTENTPTHITEHSGDHSDLTVNMNLQIEQAAPHEMSAKSMKRILRKKRSIGSMEDLWDETVFEENQNKNLGIADQPCTNTKTIKISYGPQGEPTVLKIPAQIENLNIHDDLEGENVGTEVTTKAKDITNKAARRALKRARKEARRKVLLTGGSPCYLGNGSPRYAIASSPRYTVGSASPRHGLGNNSPRYVPATAYELSVPRRRKHKMKHKKKHKEDKDRKHKETEVTSTQEDTAKEHYVTQKLSINLKRLNNTYTSCQAVSEKSTDHHSSSDEHTEQAPDFSDAPSVLPVKGQPMSSATGASGEKLLVGDIVWGKMRNYPWWPGKVLTITNVENQGPKAHVIWYGTKDSYSLLKCDQLSSYLDNFKVRYNKKQKGKYKEAIKQASMEAREKVEVKLRESLVNSSPAHSIISVVSPALASPREIDVVS